MRNIAVIAHDIRSTHNVGALLRTAEGLGVHEVYFSGITPYPHHESDERLPHLHQKLNRQIHKTALGAEQTQQWSHSDNVIELINTLRKQGYSIIGLEQHKTAIALPKFSPPDKLALLLGREVEGIEGELLNHCDSLVEIPMLGQKESLNVVQAAAIAMYHCQFAA